MLKKRFFALLSVVAVVSLLLPIAGVSAQAAGFANTHSNTGDQRADVLAVAKTQVGYAQGTLEGTQISFERYTKYGVWYEQMVDSSMNYSQLVWSGSFLSWCAAQANIPQSVIPYNAYVPDMAAWFRERGLWQEAKDCQPSAGDLVFFGTDSATSVGIVANNNGYYMTVYRGDDCFSDGEQMFGYVTDNSYSVSASSICGYATPAYETGGDPLLPAGIDARRVALGTSVEQLLGCAAVVGYTAQVYKGDVLCTDGAAATGMTLRVTDGGGRQADFTLYVTGDLTGDGAATTADVRRVLRLIITGASSLPWEQCPAADIDGNGEITSADARLLLLQVS